MKALLTCLGLGVCLLTAPFASAATIDFTTGSSTDGNENPANSLCYSAAGASTACNGSQFLTVTAWGVTGGSGGNSTLVQAALGRYAGANLGLGVCNQSEGNGCDAPNHEVDNSGHLDFVLFTFSSAVKSASVVLNPVCDCYTDSTYFVGNAITSISGKTLAGLTSDGFAAGVNTPGGKSQQSLSLTGPAGGETSILVGADVAGSHFGQDFFKIGSITYTTSSSVPEPGSLTSLGLGLGLLGWFGRRKIAKKYSQGQA